MMMMMMMMMMMLMWMLRVDEDEDDDDEDEEGEDEDENEDDDPLPPGNLLSGGTRGDRTWACQGGRGSLTGKLQGFQLSWCLPIPC